jgi:hypothetical protein
MVMQDTLEKDHRPQDRHDPYELTDQGAATQRTRGTALEYPFYEFGIPPYNHVCPNCDEDRPF